MIRIVTSCTGEKRHSPENQLALEDFQRGGDDLARREEELSSFASAAGELYTGQQHLRLMAGVAAYRQSGGEIDLRVLSAGYGLVEESRVIVPYEATFIGMASKAVREWGERIGAPAAVREALAQPCELQLVLLGDGYLSACALDDKVRLGGPTIVFCGKGARRKLPTIAGLLPVVLTNAHAKRFSCGLVGLKGEVAKRLLSQIAEGTLTVEEVSTLPPDELLDRLAGSASSPAPAPAKVSRGKPTANPLVDQVIAIPDEWWQSPHKQRISYFIPEWDDLVDPDYDFENDVHSGGSGDWSNEVYAHQMYPSPNYDGILVSRAVAEKSRGKKERINAMGVHRFLRVPREYPIMGDCGAFDYIMSETPPYTTADVLHYYTRLGFDFGVSVDHLIVKATEHAKDFRYGLTIHNAEEFLREHRATGLPWTPIGAVQGWSPESYAEAARQYAAMGYDYIGLGGLVRTSTAELFRVVRAVREQVPDTMRIHLFGIARPRAIGQFADMGVTSVDSASFLRRAWMGTGQNYLDPEGRFYAAIRIPEANKSFRSKRMVSEGRASEAEVVRMEQECLRLVRALDRGEAGVQQTLDAILEYDRLITPGRPDNAEVLRQVLEDRPWKRCDCSICQRDGVEVAIFRGNNRNRRRGFHNTYVFYRLFQAAARGEVLPKRWADEDEELPSQASLFEVALS
jgi:hypothetical protein